MPARAILALRWALVVLVALLALRAGRDAWERAAHTPVERASDALPVYLSAAAVIDGEDPTTQPGLKAAYDRRGMTVRAATFSNLYPATAGVLAGPLSTGTWEVFVPRWRALLLLGAALAGALGALAGVRGPAAPLAAAAGAWMALGAFPVTAECVALGQANLLVGGLLAVAMAALAGRAEALAGVAVVLGAGLKLVPGVLLWPVLAARRKAPLALAVAASALLTATTVAVVPAGRVAEGVLATLKFQAHISPDWMHRTPSPDWMLFLGDLRHTALGLWTLLLAGLAGWAVRGDPGAARRVLPATGALAAAWLGADAAGFHVLYAPLYIPALAWVSLWALDRDAPRWAALLAPLGLLPALILGWEGAPVAPEARLVLAGLVVWAAAAFRMLWECPPLPRWGWLPLGAAAGWGIARADLFGEIPLGPPPSEVADVTGYGLPEGVGHGGPSPGDGPVPVEGVLAPTDTLGGTRLEEVLAPETNQRLTSHLVQAPLKWGALDHPLARRVVETAPEPPAALVTYGEMAVWLAWERHAAGSVPGARAAADELERTWRVLERDSGR